MSGWTLKRMKYQIYPIFDTPCDNDLDDLLCCYANRGLKVVLELGGKDNVTCRAGGCVIAYDHEVQKL